MQQEDPDLKLLFAWLESDEIPDDEFALAPPATKRFWQCKSQLLIENEVLFYVWKFKNNRTKNLLFIPHQLKTEVLKICHDNITAGHSGVKETQNKVRGRFIWHNLLSDCENYVKSCEICHMQKKHTKNLGHHFENIMSHHN